MSRLRAVVAVVAVATSLALAGESHAAAALPTARPGGSSPLALVPARALPSDTPIDRGSCRAKRASDNSCFIVFGRKLTADDVDSLVASQGVARARAHATVAPQQAQAPADGYGALDLESMYGVPSTTNVTSTIGIVDWGQDPTIEADMNAYRTKFGLPACTSASGCFHELAQNNGQVPVAKSGEIGEITLDVEAVSALCPTCHITLADAYNSTDQWIYPAIDSLAGSGIHFISMSFGGDESAVESAHDAKYIARPNTIYVASTGDNGYNDGSGNCGGVPVCDPASAPNVVAVGGTSVLEDSQYYYLSAWKGAGSGCALHTKETAAQLAAIGNPCQGGRATSDVSALADPNTGAATFSTSAGWEVVGGTSLAAPLITTLYAIAGNTSNPFPFYTSKPSQSALLDITHGSTTGCNGTVVCSAGTGWDGPTGVGTPTSPSLFAASPASGIVLTPVDGTSATVAVGQALTGSAFSAAGGSGGYHWTATGLPSGLTVDPTSGAWSGAPSAVGTYNIQFTVADAANLTSTASASFVMTVQQSVLTLTTASGSNAFVLALKGFAVDTPMATAHGATGSLTWSATGLPAGLTIDPATGVVSGTPTAIGDSNVALSAVDASAGTATLKVDFEVVQPYGCSGRLRGRVGRRLTDDCGNYWSTAPNNGGKWIKLPGFATYSTRRLPAGLAINARTGVIGGAPRRAGSGSFLITARLRPDGILLTKAAALLQTVRYTIR